MYDQWPLKHTKNRTNSIYTSFSYIVIKRIWPREKYECMREKYAKPKLLFLYN